MKTILNKLSKDNVGTLAAIVAWNVLTSLVPIMVGLIAISGFFLRNSPSTQASVVTHLSSALQGVVTPKELKNLVATSTKHTGLLGIIGFLGVLWGGSNVGGSISTVFQAVFEVRGRSFIIEKLIDIGMIFVFTILMVMIIVGTTAGSIVKRLFTGFALPGVATFAIGTAISVVAALLLFAAIYMVFPHVKRRLEFGQVWKGALAAAIVFEILTYIFPVYAHFAHFQSHGALLGALALLTAWIYFFAITMLLGAEIVAISSIKEAQAKGEDLGPAPNDFVPSHAVLRTQTDTG